MTLRCQVLVSKYLKTRRLALLGLLGFKFCKKTFFKVIFFLFHFIVLTDYLFDFHFVKLFNFFSILYYFLPLLV